MFKGTLYLDVSVSRKEQSMTHEQIRAQLLEILNKSWEDLLEDDTKCNYISVVAKIWHELSDIDESQLKWMKPKDLDELILTVYYALSRERHALSWGVNKQVVKYVRHEYKDWEFAQIMEED
jgi:hypothetical protein